MVATSKNVVIEDARCAIVNHFNQVGSDGVRGSEVTTCSLTAVGNETREDAREPRRDRNDGIASSRVELADRLDPLCRLSMPDFKAAAIAQHLKQLVTFSWSVPMDPHQMCGFASPTAATRFCRVR